ncbi:heat-inducible transcriptional repressor HrcA [Pectinatus sottacetonis]|uniref:heat-inducible transcriptional repressor HrcA n=1 Tax=Pectinatus sottacetonis TaxID=1002795 RepID=UPI0018C656A8|nr:heat-inducible transcriptional repressor HrcA [Pectinatus sottacetonis]
MLNKRKQRILQAIIDDYISTAEPIGSRTIARKYNLGISPATIRNEMADLEFLGYIEHLHTSSGRIPSSKGYRLYVDDLLTPTMLSDSEMNLIEQWYDTKVQRLDGVFRETAKIISHLTNNISMVITPQLAESVFNYIKFVPLDDEHVIAAIMSDTGYIENKIIKMPLNTSLADFEQMAVVINEYLSGKKIHDISMGALHQMRSQIVDAAAFNKIINILEQILANEKRNRIYTEGTPQLLEQPEFHDINKVKNILMMLEEEPVLRDILYSHTSDNTGLTVTIGQENKYNTIKDCSIIRATYHLDGQPLGTIAVLGPTRMEYSKIMALLEFMNENMAQILKRYL